MKYFVIVIVVILFAAPLFAQEATAKPQPRPRDPGIVGVEQLNYIFDRTVLCGVSPFTQMRSPSDTMLDVPKFQNSGVDLLLKVLRESPKKVHIVSTGSARVLAVAWARMVPPPNGADVTRTMATGC